jgi:hypothetical protein
MSFVGRASAILLAAVVFVWCGGSPYGGPVPISDFPSKSLDLKYDDGDGLIATLDYAYAPTYLCDLLDDDAFARLNGRPVSLFQGAIQVTPPQGDDGSVNCLRPSVTVNPIPADLAPPWTIEIGDSSEVLAATFDLKSITPAAVGPVANPVLSSWTDTLTILLEDDPGDTVPISAQATTRASNGRGSIEPAQIGESSLVFPEVLDPESAPGPITVQVIADYFSAAELLDCQAPQCSLALGSGSVTLWTTTNFTIQLACNAPSGVCP